MTGGRGVDGASKLRNEENAPEDAEVVERKTFITASSREILVAGAFDGTLDVTFLMVSASVSVANFTINATFAVTTKQMENYNPRWRQPNA